MLQLWGDGAPNLLFAQGAVMAIEDAWVLRPVSIVMGWADCRPINPFACRGSRGFWRRQIRAWKYHLANPIVRGLRKRLGAGTRIGPHAGASVRLDLRP